MIKQINKNIKKIRCKSPNKFNEVTRELPGCLQISNTRGPPMTCLRRLSNLDRLCAIQTQYHIDISGAISRVLAVDQHFAGSISTQENIFSRVGLKVVMVDYGQV